MDLEHRFYVTSISENFQKAKIIFDFRGVTKNEIEWSNVAGIEGDVGGGHLLSVMEQRFHKLTLSQFKITTEIEVG